MISQTSKKDQTALRIFFGGLALLIMGCSSLFSQGTSHQSRNNHYLYRVPTPQNFDASDVTQTPWQSQRQPNETTPSIGSDKWWPDDAKELKPQPSQTHYDPNIRFTNHHGRVQENSNTFADSITGTFDPVSPENDANQSNEFAGVLGAIRGEGLANDLSRQLGDMDMQKVGGSLAVVLGGYFGFVWFWRRFSQNGARSGLPSEVLEVIGQTSFGPRRTLQLVRLGNKLLLILNSPEGTHPIGEVTDAEEVEHITRVCSGNGFQGQVERKHALQNIVGQVQNGAFIPQSPPLVTPYVQPQVVATPMIQHPVQPPTASTSELERVIKQLTQVVQQSNLENRSKREYEA